MTEPASHGLTFAYQAQAAAQGDSLVLPNGLIRQGVSVLLEEQSVENSGDRIVEVSAAFDGHKLTQRLRFARHGQIWQLIAAQLGA
ncbi:MAG: hypothetical protein ABSF29_12435 [Tepidisphaeraceae bacterium]